MGWNTSGIGPKGQEEALLAGYEIVEVVRADRAARIVQTAQMPMARAAARRPRIVSLMRSLGVMLW